MILRTALALICAAVFIAASGVLSADRAIAKERVGRDLPVTTSAIDHFRIRRPGITTFGPFTYLGGFELASPIGDFGGLSALRTIDEGRVLLMLGDNGMWVRLALEQGEDGTPISVENGYLAPVLDANGRNLIGSNREDSESLVVLDDEVWIGFERVHRILRFPFDPETLTTQSGTADALRTRASNRMRLPSDMKFRFNGSFEALAHLPSEKDKDPGALLAIAERPLVDGTPEVNGWVLPLGEDEPIRFRYRTSNGFQPTDAAPLPDGQILVLERRFVIFGGVSMRLVRLNPATISSGALVAGEVLMQVGMDHHIDNMEGLDVTTAPDGSTLITLVSDNNHSLLQRTLVLRFRLN